MINNEARRFAESPLGGVGELTVGDGLIVSSRHEESADQVPGAGRAVARAAVPGPSVDDDQCAGRDDNVDFIGMAGLGVLHRLGWRFGVKV